MHATQRMELKRKKYNSFLLESSAFTSLMSGFTSLDVILVKNIHTFDTLPYFGNVNHFVIACAIATALLYKSEEDGYCALP